jgi:hypothetical protein
MLVLLLLVLLLLLLLLQLQALLCMLLTILPVSFHCTRLIILQTAMLTANRATKKKD